MAELQDELTSAILVVKKELEDRNKEEIYDPNVTVKRYLFAVVSKDKSSERSHRSRSLTRVYVEERKERSKSAAASVGAVREDYMEEVLTDEHVSLEYHETFQGEGSSIRNDDNAVVYNLSGRYSELPYLYFQKESRYNGDTLVGADNHHDLNLSAFEMSRELPSRLTEFFTQKPEATEVGAGIVTTTTITTVDSTSNTLATPQPSSIMYSGSMPNLSNIGSGVHTVGNEMSSINVIGSGVGISSESSANIGEGVRVVEKSLYDLPLTSAVSSEVTVGSTKFGSSRPAELHVYSSSLSDLRDAPSAFRHIVSPSSELAKFQTPIHRRTQSSSSQSEHFFARYHHHPIRSLYTDDTPSTPTLTVSAPPVTTDTHIYDFSTLTTPSHSRQVSHDQTPLSSGYIPTTTRTSILTQLAHEQQHSTSHNETEVDHPATAPLPASSESSTSRVFTFDEINTPRVSHSYSPHRMHSRTMSDIISSSSYRHTSHIPTIDEEKTATEEMKFSETTAASVYRPYSVDRQSSGSHERTPIVERPSEEIIEEYKREEDRRTSPVFAPPAARYEATITSSTVTSNIGESSIYRPYSPTRAVVSIERRRSLDRFDLAEPRVLTQTVVDQRTDSYFNRDHIPIVRELNIDDHMSWKEFEQSVLPFLVRSNSDHADVEEYEYDPEIIKKADLPGLIDADLFDEELIRHLRIPLHQRGAHIIKHDTSDDWVVIHEREAEETRRAILLQQQIEANRRIEEEQRQRHEEELRLQREFELRRQREEQERLRLEEETRIQREYEFRRQQTEEEERRRREYALRIEEEQRQRHEEELRLQREFTFKRQQEEEAARRHEEELRLQKELALRHQQEEEAARRHEEELRIQREFEIRRQREEEEIRIQREVEIRRQQHEQEEKLRREEESRIQYEIEVMRREEEELRIKREVEMRLQREEMRRRKEEEHRRVETERIRWEEEERSRQEREIRIQREVEIRLQEDAQRRRHEEELETIRLRKIEEERRREEEIIIQREYEIRREQEERREKEARQRAEFEKLAEEAKRQRDEEDSRRQRLAEERRIRREKEEQRLLEEEIRVRREAELRRVEEEESRNADGTPITHIGFYDDEPNFTSKAIEKIASNLATSVTDVNHLLREASSALVEKQENLYDNVYEPSGPKSAVSNTPPSTPATDTIINPLARQTAVHYASTILEKSKELGDEHIIESNDYEVPRRQNADTHENIYDEIYEDIDNYSKKHIYAEPSRDFTLNENLSIKTDTYYSPYSPQKSPINVGAGTKPIYDSPPSIPSLTLHNLVISEADSTTHEQRSDNEPAAIVVNSPSFIRLQKQMFPDLQDPKNKENDFDDALGSHVTVVTNNGRIETEHRAYDKNIYEDIYDEIPEDDGKNKPSGISTNKIRRMSRNNQWQDEEGGLRSPSKIPVPTYGWNVVDSTTTTTHTITTSTKSTPALPHVSTIPQPVEVKQTDYYTPYEPKVSVTDEDTRDLYKAHRVAVIDSEPQVSPIIPKPTDEDQFHKGFVKEQTRKYEEACAKHAAAQAQMKTSHTLKLHRTPSKVTLREKKDEKKPEEVTPQTPTEVVHVPRATERRRSVHQIKDEYENMLRSRSNSRTGSPVPADRPSLYNAYETINKEEETIINGTDVSYETDNQMKTTPSIGNGVAIGSSASTRTIHRSVNSLIGQNSPPSSSPLPDYIQKETTTTRTTQITTSSTSASSGVYSPTWTAPAQPEPVYSEVPVPTEYNPYKEEPIYDSVAEPIYDSVAEPIYDTVATSNNQNQNNDYYKPSWSVKTYDYTYRFNNSNYKMPDLDYQIPNGHISNGYDKISSEESQVLHEWDPRPLVESLYSISYEPRMETKRNRFINMEGHVEVPSEETMTVAELERDWKQQYMRTKEGRLQVFVSHCAEESPVTEYVLSGSDIDANRDERTLNIHGGKKNIKIVLRVPSAVFDKWRQALLSHTASCEIDAYVKPIPRALPHITKNVVIIELGSCSIRGGLLNQQQSLPESFFPAIACRTEDGQMIVGADAYAPEVRHRGEFVRPIQAYDPSLERYTLNKDVVIACMQKVVHDLNVDPSKYQVLLSIPQNIPNVLIGELVTIALNDLRFQGAAITRQPSLILYAYDVTTGVVVDIGDRLNIVPVIDGYVVDSAICSIPYGATQVREALRTKLCSNNKGLYSFQSPIEKLILRYVMEQTSYVPEDYAKEESSKKNDVNVSLQPFSIPSGVPDAFNIDGSRFMCTEGLFNPKKWSLDTKGLHQLIHDAVQQSPIDSRRILYRNIFLAGGASLLPGLAERLEHELAAIVPNTIHTQVHISPWRYNAAYLGAQIVAGSSTFEDSCVTQENLQKYLINLSSAPF